MDEIDKILRMLRMSKEEMKKRFKELLPGSVIHLGLEGDIYWNIKEGKLAFESNFPDHWPLEDFVGWYLHTSNLEIGPKLSPFSIYLRDGNKHTGLGFEFPWEYITGIKVWNEQEPLFKPGD